MESTDEEENRENGERYMKVKKEAKLAITMAKIIVFEQLHEEL